jgi:murein DD-endopeptidase MepM/ murein hydrolase activator NlpD
VKKPKLFLVLPETLGVREMKHFRRKILGLSVGGGFLVLATVLGTNHWLNDVLDLGYKRVNPLEQENAILKEQLRALNQKLTTVDSTLDRLADRENELRLAVDLPKLDEDIRKVGIGGANDSYDFGLSSEEANGELRNASMKLEKIERELNLQRDSYAEIYRKFQFNKVFFAHIPAIKPMEGFYAANSFGYRNHPILQVMRFHEGLDIVNDVGTPVKATGDGVVRLVGRNAGYGLSIEIDHGYGYQTVYAHLSKALVRIGQRVRRGDLIARSGHSGLVSGPHLHYEVRLNGDKQNPLNYFFEDPTPPTPIVQVAIH